jgi:uncharacterized membrane protein YhaH (DUF805 family)
MEWYLDVFRKYAQFDGRARRKEYWMFTLFNLVAYFVLAIVGFLFVALLAKGEHQGLALLFLAPIWIYGLAVIIPGLAVTVRRLHDTGRSGWWILISFVPFVGGIILLVFTCLDSEPGTNLYGLNPKGIEGFQGVMPPYPGA